MPYATYPFQPLQASLAGAALPAGAWRGARMLNATSSVAGDVSSGIRGSSRLPVVAQPYTVATIKYAPIDRPAPNMKLGTRNPATVFNAVRYATAPSRVPNEDITGRSAGIGHMLLAARRKLPGRRSIL